MSDTEINAAIAEVCGWMHPDDCTREPQHIWQSPLDGCCYDEVPDYVNDLNAMHEAEKQFNPPKGDDWGTYLGLLDGLVKSRIHAPSKARAEAFLKTVGKWK